MFNAMLTKAFDAVNSNAKKFLSLIKFLQVKNGNFKSQLPDAQDALRYVKMVKHNGSSAGNPNKDNSDAEKSPSDEGETRETQGQIDSDFTTSKKNPKENSNDSEFDMMRALEEELSQLNLDKKIFNKTLKSDFNDVEFSKILNAQDYNANLSIKNGHSIQNWREAVSNFDSRANISSNCPKMNNFVQENYEQMYQNYMMQNNNVFQHSNEVEFTNEMNQNMGINSAQVNQNNCDSNMHYNYDQYPQNTYHQQVQQNMTGDFNPGNYYTGDYDNSQNIENNNYYCQNYSNQNTYYNEVPNQFQYSNDNSYVPQNYSDANYENQYNYGMFDQYGNNTTNSNTCYANNENCNTGLSSNNQTKDSNTNYYANQNTGEQQSNCYYTTPNGNMNPTTQFDSQINNTEQQKTFSNYDNAQMVNDQTLEQATNVSKTHDIISGMPCIRQLN